MYCFPLFICLIGILMLSGCCDWLTSFVVINFDSLVAVEVINRRMFLANGMSNLEVKVRRKSDFWSIVTACSIILMDLTKLLVLCMYCLYL